MSYVFNLPSFLRHETCPVGAYLFAYITGQLGDPKMDKLCGYSGLGKGDGSKSFTDAMDKEFGRREIGAGLGI